MANPKRASMREGPLAALFRKTEGEDGEAAGGTETEPAPAAEAATPAAAAATSATEATTRPSRCDARLRHPASA